MEIAEFEPYISYDPVSMDPTMTPNADLSCPSRFQHRSQGVAATRKVPVGQGIQIPRHMSSPPQRAKLGLPTRLHLKKS